MGANFQSYTFNKFNPGAEKETIQREWEAMREENLHECGHDSYSGGIGTMAPGVDFVSIRPFESEAEAEEYLADNHDKWDAALAVPYKGSILVPTKEEAAHAEKLQKAQAYLDALMSRTLIDIKSTKSKTIGCKKCGSHINRQYLREESPTQSWYTRSYDLTCPICRGASLLSDTQKKLLAAAQKKVSDLEHAPIKEGWMRKDGIAYVVGGWCAE